MDARDRDSTVETVRSSGGARPASAAASSELQRSAGDPPTPERDDPGGGADITGTTEPVRPDGTADPAAPGLGETAAGGTLEDYEQTLKRARDRRRRGG